MKAWYFIYIFYLLTALIVTNSCSHEKHEEENEIYYQCPMHPQVISDKPGNCPICGMQLVKRVKEKPGADTLQTKIREEDIDNFVMLTGRGYKLANVATITVRRENVYKEIRAFGKLDFNEPGRRLISAKFSGRIQNLYVNSTGQHIKAGSPLFEVYSPDLALAQNEYLVALRAYKTIESASQDLTQLKNSASILSSAKNKLLIMGLTETQISSISKQNTAMPTFKYFSEYSGTVLEKRVQEGMYINEGSVLYDLADMSVLWNIAEVYADDVNFIKLGSPAVITVQNFPGETVTGRVSFVYPVVNQESRTIKVRTPVINKSGKLKPEMYTESLFTVNLGSSPVVPENAVLFTGRRNIVWVLVDKNTFEPREITLGVKFDSKYQVISGLSEGEQIASSGAYLIDSESRLKTGNQSESSSGHTSH